MKTTIDWLKFRTQSNPFKIIDSMLPVFGTCADLVTLVPAEKGRDGWERRQEIMLTDIRLGAIDYGGESQRGWVRVDMPGTGCEWIHDWEKVGQLGDLLDGFEPQRVDIALTTFKGEVTDSMVVRAHKKGLFKAGGRGPEIRNITSSNPRAGKTRYIGTREQSDKFLRCYEKGFEMIKNLPEGMRNNVTHVNGNLVDEVYRVELELKAVNKPIPVDVFAKRDEYFAGAYPFLAGLLPGVPHRTIDALPDEKPVSELAAMLAHCKSAYGPAIFTALQVYGGDAEKVMRMIVGSEHSRRLVEAGVLTLDKVGREWVKTAV
jgi:DNA relaxase NicK